MYGILIRYTYSGDEDAWRAAVDNFIAAINGDAELGGRFSYSVNVAGDGESRIHVGRWDSDETLALVQSRDYFKTFAGKVQEFAGDSLQPMRFSNVAASGG